ncbi:MAG: Uma2 family endonuclease [Isosphaerales bacterium]
MATIDAINRPRRKTWTLADLYRRFGPMPFERIRQNPPPGTATVDDVVRLNDHEDRLYELVDGILVEKTVGYEESYIAGEILTRLKNFVERRKLGLVNGEGGMVKLDIDLVRIPDVSFVSWDRVPGRKFPTEQVPPLVPDLAVEVISPSNTPKEMDEKLHEYFEKGGRLVWFVRPKSRVVDVYTAPDRFTRLTASARLDGGDVLPGFSVQVGKLFQKPKAPGNDKGKEKEKKNGPRRGR